MCTDLTVKSGNKMKLERSRGIYADNINHVHEALWFEAFDGWFLKVEGLKFKIENRLHRLRKWL